MTTTIKESLIEMSITKEDLMELSEYHNTSCISIYISTHHQGVETLKGQDALTLKNQTKEVRNKLSANGMSEREIKKLISPVLGLVNDADFWRHQSGGLAVFVSEKYFRYHLLPGVPEELNYVSSEFFIKPLLTIFNDDGLFYILTLSRNDVHFYEGNKYALTERNIDVPSRLEDSVGYDYEQKQQQFRTQWGGNKPGSFHGHGESESRDKSELQLFFRDIDKGVMTFLRDNQEPPLVLCCLDKYYAVYSDINTHKNLFTDFISVNPADLDNKLLHERAWEIIRPYFSRRLHEKKEKFFIAFDRGKASRDIKEIIPAAVHGKVDTIFISLGPEIYGIYDPSNGGVSIHEEHNMSNVSLSNLAAKKVYALGGTVYLLGRHEMPDGSADLNALFRY